MSEFSELIKSFDKIRDYMRDFYIYGFKVRGDYTYKSARTYDNERRRIESWLSRYIRWDRSVKGKRVFLSVDSSRVPQNPLFAAWKSKSFTRTDILLHFYLLDLLSGGEAAVEELADAICERHGELFDAQTVRIKLKEYERLGLVESQKRGRALYYSLREDHLRGLEGYPRLLDAVRLFQEAAPFGFVGSTILDAEESENDLFRFKHHFIVHTLEDGILQELLRAIGERRAVCLENRSRRTGAVSVVYGVPLRILTSAQSGRRYLCLYRADRRRFVNLRLDSLLSSEMGESVPNFETLQTKLDANLPKCWGVSFGGASRGHWLFLKLRIDENREGFLLERIRREGRGGELLRVGQNVFLYSIQVFDVNEVLPWIKTFTGRILSLESGDKQASEKFFRDMERMYRMYCEGAQ